MWRCFCTLKFELRPPIEARFNPLSFSVGGRSQSKWITQMRAFGGICPEVMLASTVLKNKTKWLESALSQIRKSNKLI